MFPPSPSPAIDRHDPQDYEDNERDRANFLRILEELNAIAREESRAQYTNYLAIVGVFENPLSHKPYVYAERVPFDASEADDDRKPETEPEAAPWQIRDLLVID